VGTKRLTRKEIIREDKIHSALAGTYDWFGRNSTFIIIGVVIVALAFGGAYLWRYFSEASGERLQAEYGQALEIYNAPATSEGQQPPTASPSKFTFATPEERYQKAMAAFAKIADDAPRSDIGQYSKYYVALCRYRLGQTAEAKKELEALAASGSEALIRDLARNVLAEAAQAEKNNQQTVTLLKQILDDSAEGFPKQSVLLQLGQAYEALGNKDEAVKQYKRIVTEYPNSAESQQAQAKLDALQKQASR
jgi:predicted negative regulator of RcsB-dependent stress response